MDLTASAAPAVSTTTAPKGLTAASFVLGGSLLSLTGLSWDIQWHSDVGPDTFFTLPHLFLYSGSAVAGIASLVVVLLTTAAQRAGRPVDPIVGGRAVPVFGRAFAAPVGYLVSGVGAASFLLYGLWDQWWHGLYGFDAVIASPPHIGLLLSVTLTMIGSVMVFATAREHRWGVVGLVGSLATLIGFSVVLAIGFGVIPAGPVLVIPTVTAFLCVVLVVTGGRVLARPGGLLGVAAVVVVLQAVYWWFSPWASRVYADAVGLPMRDVVRGVPGLPAMLPMTLLAVAALMELLLWAGRRTGAGLRYAVLAGGLGGLLLAVTQELQGAWLYGRPAAPVAELVATAVAGTVLGLLAGFLGTRFGEMLRQLAPAGEAR
ncbi:hypothetical protein JOF53_002097 [Crossiella equi]|uniref:Uncharacterized protein n=1 Tax=Crossiella equi TaxID=130796 RepID=A0ABS5A9H9_9PSEU|nr:hypothetical protein [Crossiella equi]MBP2473225.1 hypothetical protein [Crossiella equi]